MAANYTLIASQSSVQVLSPTVTLDTVVATVQTQPHGVIFDYWIAKDTWDAGDAPTLLTAVCGDVETIMRTSPVVSATGRGQLDASGLLAQYIVFTVGYTPPGSNFGPATVDVSVPVGDFGQDTINGVNAGMDDADSLIQAAYSQLQAVA